MKEVKKIKPITIVYALGVLVIFFVGAIFLLNYIFGINNRVTKMANKIIPFPAATINYTHWITLNQVEENVKAVQIFYENQDFSSVGLRVDFKTDDGKKRLMIKEKGILNKEIEDQVIELLAKDRGINLTDDVISQEVDRVVQEVGDEEDIKKQIESLYGWDMEQFKEKIVKPSIYKEKLSEYVGKNEQDLTSSKSKIADAVLALNEKKAFEDVVAKYSEGESAKNSGELGWFSAEQMLPQISLFAFQMKKGQVSDIIESSLGYHIIKLEDKKTEDGVEKVRIKQIFVKIPNFADWLTEKEKSFKIMIFQKDFRWSKQNENVEFVDNNLTEFEKNILENSPGDASVTF